MMIKYIDIIFYKIDLYMYNYYCVCVLLKCIFYCVF